MLVVTNVQKDDRKTRLKGSVVKTLPRGSLLSKCHKFSRFTCKCDWIYAYKKCTQVPAPIYIKVANNVTCRTTFYAEFHPDRTTKMERSGRHSFAPWNKARLSLGQASRNSPRLDQCFSIFVRPQPGKFFFHKTRARSQQMYS